MLRSLFLRQPGLRASPRFGRYFTSRRQLKGRGSIYIRLPFPFSYQVTSLNRFGSVIIVFVVMTLLSCQGLKNEIPKEVAWKNNKDFFNSVGMKLVRIPKASFTIGAPVGEKDRMNRETQHQVTLTKDIYLVFTEVTQAQ
jgi:formylglycine-generating enzyme required for sulfatase activity